MLIIAIIIISATLMLLYVVTSIFYVFVKPSWLFSILLENPIKASLIAKLWWYGSLFVFSSCIAYHFITKYW